jgi:hypothetical protein
MGVSIEKESIVLHQKFDGNVVQDIMIIWIFLKKSLGTQVPTLIFTCHSIFIHMVMCYFYISTSNPKKKDLKIVKFKLLQFDLLDRLLKWKMYIHTLTKKSRNIINDYFYT